MVASKRENKCFTCGKPCYGYQCDEHKGKGRWGSPARREVNRRHTSRRYHENNLVNAENQDEERQKIILLE